MLELVPLLLTLMPCAAHTELVSLLDFGEGARPEVWTPVHDGVMGGVSSGRAFQGEGGMRFEGIVRLENNGGFASFRASVQLPDLTPFDGLRLRVIGDGQVYKLTLRTDGPWERVSWQAPFATSDGTWTSVDLAFEDLVPTWRGRLVSEAPPFDPARIEQIGLSISDKQSGSFALELGAIDAWRDNGPAAEAGSYAAHRARSTEIAAAVESESDARALTRALRWSERALVVSAPAELDAAASRQLARLLATGSELAARELRLVSLLGTRGGRLAGRTLEASQVRDLRELWEIPADEWSLALVGKDGGVKRRWTSPVEPAEIFALIDAMPMRRREMGERVPE